MAVTVLMLYLCADKPSVHQLLKQNHSLQIVAPLIESPFTEVKLLSKALIARLIPANVASDDLAVLMLIQDDEVDHLISVLTSEQSYNTVIPVISVMMDLSRSPHNMGTFVSKNIALVLSNSMDSISEEDQIKATQLIQRMLELNYEGSEDMYMIINNGSLQDRPSLEDGMITCVYPVVYCLDVNL